MDAARHVNEGGSMRRFFKRLFSFVFCFALAFVIIQYGPNIYMRLFGDGNARWISERFSETLREKNELVVLWRER